MIDQSLQSLHWVCWPDYLRTVVPSGWYWVTLKGEMSLERQTSLLGKRWLFMHRIWPLQASSGWICPAVRPQCAPLHRRKAWRARGWDHKRGVLQTACGHRQERERLEQGGDSLRAGLGYWHWQDCHTRASSGSTWKTYACKLYLVQEVHLALRGWLSSNVSPAVAESTRWVKVVTLAGVFYPIKHTSVELALFPEIWTIS